MRQINRDTGKPQPPKAEAHAKTPRRKDYAKENRKVILLGPNPGRIGEYRLSRVVALAIVTLIVFSAGQSLSQTQSNYHEVAPFLGLYAPDRFETSVAFGLRYFYKIDERFGVGAVLGFAHARQDYVKQVSGAALQPGSDRVLFHGARATYTYHSGKIDPYFVLHLGLTRLYDENSFTYGIGIGTKIAFRRRFTLRYEFMNYVFASGRDLSAWTNKNIEVAFILGYML